MKIRSSSTKGSRRSTHRPYEVLSAFRSEREPSWPTPARANRQRHAHDSRRDRIDELQAPDVLLVRVPASHARAGGPALEWVRAVHETTTWTTPYASGS